MAPRLQDMEDRARLCVTRGEYAVAVDLYNQLAESDPDNPHWFQNLGEALRLLGKNTEAIGSYERAIQIHALLGDELKSLALCKVILELDPSRESTRSIFTKLSRVQRVVGRAAPARAIPSPARAPSSAPWERAKASPAESDLPDPRQSPWKRPPPRETPPAPDPEPSVSTPTPVEEPPAPSGDEPAEGLPSRMEVTLGSAVPCDYQVMRSSTEMVRWGGGEDGDDEHDASRSVSLDPESNPHAGPGEQGGIVRSADELSHWDRGGDDAQGIPASAPPPAQQQPASAPPPAQPQRADPPQAQQRPAVYPPQANAPPAQPPPMAYPPQAQQRPAVYPPQANAPPAQPPAAVYPPQASAPPAQPPPTAYPPQLGALPAQPQPPAYPQPTYPPQVSAPPAQPLTPAGPPSAYPAPASAPQASAPQASAPQASAPRMQPPAAAGPSSAGPPSRPQRPAPADPFASAEQAPGSAPVEEPEEDEDSVWMEFDLDDASAGDTFDDEILNITEDNLESDGILSRLPPIPLLDTLAPEEFGELIQRAEVQMFMDGDTLFEEGDAGNSLFVLVEGMAAVTTAGPPPTDLGTLREGEVFGEVGLLTETERAATITAITDGMALEISRDAMAEVVTRHPDVLRKLLRFFRMRVLDVLIQTHELFAPYAEEDRSELERRFVFVDAGPGATLATQGQPSEALLILLAGRAAVTRDGRAIGELHAGDLLGEPSLLTGQPSVITAVTVTKCWLLKLDRATFNKLLFEHPKSLDLVTELSQRFEKQLDALETGARLELFSVTML